MWRAPIAVLVSVLLLFVNLQPAHGEARKLPGWGAACPEVVNIDPTLKQPAITKFRFNGHIFSRLADGDTQAVEKPATLVGCYVDLDAITGPSPGWQIGVINRDSIGFYWKNAANVSWRLTLDPSGDALLTDSGNPNYSTSKKFEYNYEVKEISSCKLSDPFQGGVRLGFDRSPERIAPTGNPKNLIIVTDFSDFPFSGDAEKLVANVLGPDIVTDFFRANSYNKLNLIFQTYDKTIRLPDPSTKYLPDKNGNYNVNGVDQYERFTREVVNLVMNDIDLSKYQSVALLVTGGAGMGGYFGSSSPGIMIQTPTGVVRNTLVLGIGIGTVDQLFVPSWKPFAHDIGHLLGFVDLYISGIENSGKSPGPFDLMGNTSGSANEFFGWNRWVQGWFDETSVVCDLNFPTKNQVTLNPLSGNSGKRLFVAPLSPSKLLAIEFRTETKYDKLSGEVGLLVYEVDLAIPGLKGPIRVQVSEGDVVVLAQNDREKYAKATLTVGQTLYFENYVIRSTAQSNESASFIIETKQQYQTFLAAEKLAADKAAADKAVSDKAVADAKAASEKAVVAAKKRTTITCIKGKIVKKVTAVKPKCPAGYKKK
jgi:M6 family metalloprotease-like protein